MAGPGTDRGQASHFWRFGTFELDPTSQQLRKAGALVRLQSQHFQLLAFLVERSGKVVAREEIREALWGSQTFVDFDRGINFCINQIRSVLDDDPRNPRFIETLPRKGYRFIAPVSATNAVETARGTGKDEAPGLVATPELAATSPIRRRPPLFVLLTLAGAVVVVSLMVYGYQTRHLRSRSVQSLAVLPLQNLSNDPGQEYFADGMTDELITALAKIGALRVVSRTSVLQFRGTKKPLPEIARELNVDAVVEGAVLRSHNRVRITVQLVRASPEEHLWAEQYEGSPEEVLTLQDTVAQDVARSIKVNLTAKERTLLTTPRPVDAQAHEQYLRGRYLWSWPSEENFTKSLAYFKQAIEIDPNYALAWAGLADTYESLASWGVLSNQDALPRARAAAEKALELDGSLVSPLGALATAKMNYEWDWAGVERLCRRGIELSPNDGNIHHRFATYLAEVGRMEEAVVEAQSARDAEPLSITYAANVAWKLYLARRYSESEKEWRKLIAFYPHFTGGYGLASLYLQTGRMREGIAELQKDATDSHRGILQLMYLGHGLGVSGAQAEGRAVLQEMLSLSKQRYVSPMYIAIVYEGLGEREQALKWFETAYEERAINGWILPDPQLDQIRSDPRLQDLMRRMGLPSRKFGSWN